MTAPRRWPDALLAALFSAVIALPAVATFLGFDPIHLEEKRALQPFPSLRGLADVATFPAAFESWFRDRFGFRKVHIYWVSRAKYQLLGESVTPAVVVGKGGWLYTREEIEAHASPLAPEEVEAWAASLERRRTLLSRKEVRLMVAFAPDKATIHPENLPPGTPCFSRLDQLLARSPGGILDLRPALRAARRERPAYFVTDSHWNEAGALAAYSILLDALGQPRGAFSLEARPARGGDLAEMLGLANDLRDEAFTVRNLSPEIVSREALVVVHDSFFERGLRPLFESRFPALRTASVAAARPEIFRERADAVILELAERSLSPATRQLLEREIDPLISLLPARSVAGVEEAP